MTTANEVDYNIPMDVMDDLVVQHYCLNAIANADETLTDDEVSEAEEAASDKNNEGYESQYEFLLSQDVNPSDHRFNILMDIVLCDGRTASDLHENDAHLIGQRYSIQLNNALLEEFFEPAAADLAKDAFYSLDIQTPDALTFRLTINGSELDGEVISNSDGYYSEAGEACLLQH